MTVSLTKAQKNLLWAVMSRHGDFGQCPNDDMDSDRAKLIKKMTEGGWAFSVPEELTYVAADWTYEWLERYHSGMSEIYKPSQMQTMNHLMAKFCVLLDVEQIAKIMVISERAAAGIKKGLTNSC